MRLMLDTGILGRLFHPKKRVNQPVVAWLDHLLGETTTTDVIYLPEIAYYELRRKLAHLLRKQQESTQSLDRLDLLCEQLAFLPFTRETIREATELWADARTKGMPTASDAALDGDVILAAQARSVDAIVITTNRKHLEQFVTTKEWHEITTLREATS